MHLNQSLGIKKTLFEATGETLRGYRNASISGQRPSTAEVTNQAELRSRKLRQTHHAGVVRAVREGAVQVGRGVEGVALLSRAGLEDGVLLEGRVSVRAPQHVLLSAVALQARAARTQTHKHKE